jgi:hypothetical protein
MEKCKQAELKHYVVHYGAASIEKILRNVTQKEEARPKEARKPILELLSAVGIFRL